MAAFNEALKSLKSCNSLISKARFEKNSDCIVDAHDAISWREIV